MSIFRKTQHKLLRKLTATATVIGSLIGSFSFSPTASAEIEKVDGGKITDTAGRYDIYADALINDNKTALNHFKQFNLDANKIANLYFKTSGGNVDADSLLNFINEKSTINGVVNSIKGGTIGGNVYFIAPKGIVIGSGGVINGGSIGLMTPSEDFYNSLLNDGKIDQSKLTADMIKNIEGANIPLNLSGSIAISGKLNAVDGIKVASAAVELKDESQLVSTKEIDFSSLVNVEGVDSGLDSSKLKITRSDDAEGEINLTAVAEAGEIEKFENISTDAFKEKISSVKSVEDIKTIFEDLTDVDAEASITVGAKSKITSDGNVTISATAKGDRHTENNGEDVEESLPFLNLNSKVEINGEVSGDTVAINAKTKDIFKQTAEVKAEKKDDSNNSKKDSSYKDETLESGLGKVMSKYLKLSGAYVVHNDEATVTVGNGAKITASGEDVTNSKTAETTPALKINAESKPEIELTAKGETEDKNQLLAVTVAYVNNSANVEINGAINSEDSAEIKSDANSNITQIATNKATGKDTSKLNLAGNVLIGNNKADLKLGEKSEIKTGGDLSAAANATEKIKVDSQVAIKETGLGGSSINFVNFDSSALTTASGKVTDSAKLELSAINEVNRTVTSNNGTEKISTDTKDDKDKTDTEKETEKKTSTDTAKNDTSDNSEEEDEFGLAALFADTTEVAQDKATENEDAAPPADSETETEAKDQATADKQEDSQTKSSALENVAKYLTVGASANIVLGNDKANVTINKTADLNSSGEVSINSKNNLTDQKIGAIGQTSAGSSGENKNALINAAVNVTNFNSDAAVLIKGGTINGGSVAITADNIIDYERKNDIIKTIKDTYKEIEKLIEESSWGNYKDDLVEFRDALAVASQYLFSDETINPENLNITKKEVYAANENKTLEDKIQQKIFTNLMISGAKVTTDALQIYGGQDDSKEVLGNTLALLNPATFTNFYADSSTTSTAVKNRETGTGDGSSSASVAIAGAVNVNLSDDSTRLVIGKGANIISSGDIKINSVSSRDNVVADGHLIPSGAASTSIGAIVNVNNLNSKNVLAVAQGATLEGKTLNLETNNNISNVIVNSGAGAAADKSSGKNSTVAVEGSISYVGGKSDALLSVDDGAKLSASGDLKLNSINKNDLYNVVGGLAYGHGAGSVGVALAINNFDVNTLAAIQNNDTNSSADMIDLVKAAANADALFGSGNSGTFTAGNFINSAETSGNMMALSVAGAAIQQQDKSSESENKLENFGGNLSSKYKNVENNSFTNFFKDEKTTDKNKNKKSDESESKETKIKNSGDKTLKNSNSNNSEKPKDKDAAPLPNSTSKSDLPSITVTGAGSASVNLSAIKTKSIIDGVTITSSKDFKVTADDTTNNVAASGAAALNFQKVGLSQNKINSSTTVGIAGAVAWNKVTDDLKAIVNNSMINASSGAAEISATKGGALVAAGLGFSLTSTSRQNSTSANVAANLSVNHADESTYADISNTTINAKTLTNSATNSDVQVTGGINLSVAKGGKSANAIGATVGYSDIGNESLAQIENGSKINLTGNLTNTANTNIKQITGVVGASVATGAQKTNAFNGVLAYSKLDNTADAKVDASTITATNLINRAYDGEISNSNVNYLEGAGIDTKGTDFLKNLSDDSSAADSNVGTMSTNSTGNLQIVGAFDLTVATGSNGGTGLVAVTIGDIDNDFNAVVNNSNVTGNIDADALSNSFAVNAAGGVAVSNNKFGGAGSLSWQTTDNQVKAAVTADSSNNVTGNVDLNANSKAREVSVAGEIGVSKGTAVGLAMAYNNLNLTTETDLKNIQIDGANVKTTSKNDGAIYAIGAGINVSNGTAINGSAAVNYGTNSAINNIEGVTAANATTLETTATDETYRLAIGGGANIGKNVAAGGAVVYNDIGTSDNNQQTKITVSNSNFSKLSAATIKSEDNSTLKSIAAQLSGSGKVAATGAVAITTIYKDVGNSIKNSTLAGKNSTDSNSTQDIFTTADSLAVSGKVGIGAGVAVTNDHTKTTTAFDGSTINGSNIAINSANKSDLTNIAVGAAGSGNVSVAGSVSINNLSGNTSTTLNNTNVTASKNLAVTASGDETINNYAGALSITGTGAAVGASVSVNDIQNTTAATVTGGTINVTGNDELTFKDAVADSNIINTSISKDLFQTDNSLASLKTNSTYNGFLVDAVSTNTLKSFQICGGVAGTGASVGGTVNVQNIGGSTTSKLDNAEIKGSSNLNVIANDYTNSEAMVGQIAVTGTGAAVGAAIDLQTVTRNVNAELNQKSDTSINAGNIKVDADSKQGIASLAISGGIAGTGAAVNNATGVYNLKGTTTAKTSSFNGTSTSLGVNANHLANINSVGAMAAIAGEGAGVGATVVIINETDTTSATVDKSNLTANTSDIAAKNKLNLSDQAYAVSGAGVGAGVGGLVEVGNISNTVAANVTNSTLGKSDNTKIAVLADNTTSINNIAGNGSVAGVGGAVGAGVEINTLDTQVSTNISNSTLNAKDISVDSKDNKTIKQLGVGASIAGIGAGVQVGVMITNVGEKIADSYESSSNKGKKDKDGTQVNANDSINTANNAVSENLNMVSGSDSNVKSLGLNVKTDEATAGKGSAKGGVTNTFNKATINAGNTLKVTANGTNNFDQSGVAGAGSGIGASVAGSIGIMNFKYNTSNDISGSTLTAAKNIDINTITSGANKLNLATASLSVAGASIGVGYGDLTTKGSNAVTLKNSTINSTGGNVSINTTDKTQTELNAKSFSFSFGISGGAVIGEVTSNATNNIDISGGSIKGNTIDINATRGESGKNTVKLNSTAAVASAGFSGAALVADLDANDKVNVNVSNSTKLNGSNNVNITATNNQQTLTDVDASSVGAVSANFTVVSNKQSGTATIDVAKGVEFTATNNNVTANMNGVQKLNTFALSVGAAAVDINTSKVTDNATARANLSGANFSTSGANVNVTSNNNITQNAKVTGISGGLAVFGTSRLESARNAINEVSLINSGSNKNFGTVNAAANTNSTATLNVISGKGGAIDASPEAAYLDDNAGNNTSLSISGDFTATNINVAATTTENDTRKVDATSASVAGYSGATFKHNDTTSTSINVANNSDFITTNNLNFNALNKINSSSDLIGVGAGAIRGNAADMKDGGTFTSNLNLGNNTTYKTDKDFTAQAADVLNIKSANLLKAYDIASATIANSTNNFNFKNNVTSGKTTINADNIYLKAGESGKVNLSTIADHKGGAGTAETHAYNAINRAGTVTVGDNSTLRGTTVNLTTKTASKLELNLQSDVFNYAAIPAKTAANMQLTLNQNNAINVGSKANLTADEEMVLDGAGTVTEMVKSVRYYSTFDGGGEKTIGTNDGTEKISAMSTNNIVNVNGTLEAGTHNKIGIEITGGTYKITDGADWFTGKVDFKDSTTTNPYYSRWQEVTSAMSEYPTNSDQYKALDTERASLVNQMSSEGFIKNGKPIQARTDNSIASLPTMRVSGADIKLYGDKMQGNGSITAHRGSNINVVRKSGGAIEIGDNTRVTFGNLGGIVSFNDAVAKSDNSLKITSELNDVIPVINIENKSARSDTNSADIKISGLIDNPAGNVTIKTNNGSINARGTINAQAVSMTAPNGSFTMINEQALLNFSDPITYFTFGDKDMANYIQKRVSLEAGQGNTTLNFSNATDFGNWLYDTLTQYKQSAILKKYNSDTKKENWVKAYVKRVNDQLNGGKIIAGGDVFISAKDINVNGLIQSGFINYTAEVDTAKVKSISGKGLTDDQVLGESKYLVTKNYTKSGSKNINTIDGVVENTNGYYDKQIELYYNPTTGNILSNDIYSNAGSVTLKGNILSTGGGKIVVSNGAANVSVKNESNKNLKLGNIESVEGKGIVKIIDKKQNNKESTYTSDDKYQPLANLNYRWTGGGNYTKYTDHTINLGLSETASAIGRSAASLLLAVGETVATGSISALDRYFNRFVDNFINNFYHKDPAGTLSGDSYTAYSTNDAIKKNGIYITQGISTPYLTINSQKSNVSSSKSNKNASGFIDYKTVDLWLTTVKIPKNAGVRVTWDEKETGSVTSTYSMKADNPIDIKFIKGDSNINLSSNGGITDTTVTSKKLDLTNHSSSTLDVNYNPVGTGTLNIDTRGDAVINVGGSVNVDIPHASGKNVTVNATGDITGGGDGDFGTLNLNSTKGKIDVKLTYIMRNALNATAAKDINIEQNNTFDSNKYLKLGTIESKTGNVTIKTNGDLVSAVTGSQNTTTSTQIENWKNAGIFNTYNQTELVNALNANVFSKDPSTVDLAPAANIIANKVTLDVGGSIGSTGTAKTIKYSNLKKESNLQLLANARVGDLEWGDNSVTYTPHYPIGLTLRDTTSDWNLYLKKANAGINLAAADDKTALNIYSDNSVGGTDKDVTLTAAAGIQTAYGTSGYINAKNLTLRGGYGRIVLKKGNYYSVDAITGENLSLSANFGGNLYIKNAIAGGSLTLYFPNADLLKGSNDGYISSGNSRALSIYCASFGNTKDNVPSILANNENLEIQVYKNKFGQELYLKGLQGSTKDKVIYIQDSSAEKTNVHLSPENLFKWLVDSNKSFWEWLRKRKR